MSSLRESDLGRRELLKGAGGGLLLAFAFGRELRAAVVAPGSPFEDFAPNAFVRIAPDGVVTLVAKHDEMGQGIHTGLSIAICEELEVDLEQVEVVPAPAAAAYAHTQFGIQVTGGSTSTWSSFDQMRQAGAVARDLLMRAAAARWGLDPSACEAAHGSVRERGGARVLHYGELVSEAAALPVSTEVVLKDPRLFTRIGKPTPRVDSAAKVRGTAVFSLDRRLPDMRIAVVARSPYFGGSVRSFNGSAAAAVPGVEAVLQVPSGIAVVARDTWAALKGREALEIDWDPGPGGELDSDELRERYLAKAETPGPVARSEGDLEAAMRDADETLRAVYEVPFQAHAPMEPLSCMVTLREDGGADIHTGSQMLGGDHRAAAGRLGVELERVRIENAFLGGGFGRRANPAADFTLEALEVALAAQEANGTGGVARPIKTVWTREDDLTGGWYRPYWVNAVEAGLKDGRLVAWRHRIVGQSIAAGTAFESAMVHEGIDHTSVEGAADMPHGIPNLQVELHSMELPVPVQWWRSVGHSNTAFAKECFLDECAEALGRDPYELRRELLADHPRLLGVLDLAAEKAGWGGSLPAGVGRAIAVHESFKGFAAHVVEASVEKGRPRIHRVVCAIDCGLVVNPDQVEAQMQGAVSFALSSVLEGQITLKNGRVQQSNFHDFKLVRLHEAPRIEVHIAKSGGEMGGIGEVGVPGVAAATCSALAAASGVRIRRLPIGNQLA